MDTMYSSQKQRNIAEAKKAQIVRDHQKAMQLAKEKQRVIVAETAVKARIQGENERIKTIQLTQKLEAKRREADLGREERQLKTAIMKAKTQPVGSCLGVGFFPFF